MTVPISAAVVVLVLVLVLILVAATGFIVYRRKKGERDKFKDFSTLMFDVCLDNSMMTRERTLNIMDVTIYFQLK